MEGSRKMEPLKQKTSVFDLLFVLNVFILYSASILRRLHQFQRFLASPRHLGHVTLSWRLPPEKPQRGHPRSRHHVLWPGQAAASVHDPGVGRAVGHLQQRRGRPLHQGAPGRAALRRQEHRPPVLLPRLPRQHHRHGGQIQRQGRWALDSGGFGSEKSRKRPPVPRCIKRHTVLYTDCNYIHTSVMSFRHRNASLIVMQINRVSPQHQ